MKKIFKYRVPFQDFTEVSMPKGAKIIAVQNQDESLCIWAEVNPDAPNERRFFHVYGTGHVMHEECEETYLGTAQFQRGELVFHLYEVIAVNGVPAKE